MNCSRILGAAILVFTIFLAIPAANAGTCTSSYNNAHGDNRTVAVKVLNFWLHHTYECARYKGSSGTVSGHHTFTGGPNGCTACSRFATTLVYSNTPHCVDVQDNLTYAITGVCHQGTNRALQGTSIPYVVSWGGVGGAGTSKALFCTFGASLWCYGAPC